MTFEFKRLRSSEIDFELIGAEVFITSILLMLFWFKMALPIPQCWLRAATGIPCATCGASHAMQRLLQMDWKAAMLWNPLFVTVMFLAAVLSVYAVIVVVFRLPRIRITQINVRTAWTLRILLVAVFVGNWIYVIATQAHR
ncbi:MAG: DUF2752 domain-containing protein [Chthoniobacterales bacterium]